MVVFIVERDEGKSGGGGGRRVVSVMKFVCSVVEGRRGSLMFFIGSLMLFEGLIKERFGGVYDEDW